VKDTTRGSDGGERAIEFVEKLKFKIELSKNSFLLRVVALSVIPSTVDVLRAGYRNKKQREAAIKT
jgi:hypothetical protein